MYNNFPIIDVDRHVMEPMDMWPDYLPAKHRAHAPHLRPLRAGHETLAERLDRLGDHALLSTPPIVCVGDRPICRGMTEVGYIEVNVHADTHIAEMRASESAAGQLAHMDASGVDLAMLLPTFAGFLVYDDEIDASRSRAYATAYNRWMADQIRTAPTRLRGAALMSRHAPEYMVTDLEAALRAGLTAVVMRPNPVGGRHLGAPELEPFYAACAAAGVPVLLHEGAHTRVRTAGTRFVSHFAQHACSHPMEMMMGFLALLEGGVLERHPTLRVGFLESGCGWLPYWLWRLDEIEYAQLRNEVRGRIDRPPSAYFRRQCWVAIEPGEALLDQTIEHVGADRFVFGTDFPHVDHDVDIVPQLFEGGIDPDHLGRVLWENPAWLLGLDATELAAVRNRQAGEQVIGRARAHTHTAPDDAGREHGHRSVPDMPAAARSPGGVQHPRQDLLGRQRLAHPRPRES